MNVCPTISTNSELAFPGQPAQRSLNNPARSAQSTAMSDVAAGDLRHNAATSQPLPVRIRIVGSVGVHSLWSTPGTSSLATNRRHGIDQRLQLLDVVFVGRGERGRQRDALAIDDH